MFGWRGETLIEGTDQNEMRRQGSPSFASGGVNTWIGLNDIGTEGTFTWADDSALGSYTNWNTGEPDSTAAAPAVQVKKRS